MLAKVKKCGVVFLSLVLAVTLLVGCGAEIIITGEQMDWTPFTNTQWQAETEYGTFGLHFKEKGTKGIVFDLTLHNVTLLENAETAGRLKSTKEGFVDSVTVVMDEMLAKADMTFSPKGDYVIVTLTSARGLPVGLATYRFARVDAGSSSSSSSVPTEGDAYNIFLITMDQMDMFWISVDEGCRQAIQEIQEVRKDKINYSWLAPDTKDEAKQMECINNAVAEGADAILLAAVSPTGVDSAVQAAVDAGVAVVYVDSPASVLAVATFATNNKTGGLTAGEEMKKALDAAGITSGSIGIVNVNNSTQSVVDREIGFREAFEGTDFAILETQYSDGDAVKSKDIAAGYISDEGVVGIFGTNEGCSVGIGNAIAEGGNRVIGVGFDYWEGSMRDLIRGGSLYCTMVQQPDRMGYCGMEAAYAFLEGDLLFFDGEVDTGVEVITKDTI